MADRIVFPDEVDDVKAAAAKKTEECNTNSIEKVNISDKMADRIVFPDEVNDVKAAAAKKTKECNTNSIEKVNIPDKMFNRIIFPDEVDDVKAAAAKMIKERNTNSIEEVPADPTEKYPTIEPRNMITVPPNCPPGHQMGADGVCREVFY